METATHPLVSVGRTIPATPPDVFHAWTTPDLLEKWFAPTVEYDAHVVALDPRVGGAYRTEMRHELGANHTMSGEYRAVDPPHGLTFTMDGHEGDPPSTVEVRIATHQDGAHVTLTQTGLASDDEADRHAEGWDGFLWRLANTFEPTTAYHRALVLALHRRLFANALEGLDDDLDRRLAAANDARWIAAHLAQSRAGLAAMLGAPIDHPLQAFADAVPDDTPTPDAETIRRVFAEASHAVYRGLQHASDQDLAGPPPFTIPMRAQTLLAAVDFLVSHEAYHIGQLGLLRRALGYPAMRYDHHGDGRDDR
ncbi:MAG: DinB family protein [Rubricoccaceae bacterium]|nr:DinB family protein [Rubricoccaceae bacterium]